MKLKIYFKINNSIFYWIKNFKGIEELNESSIPRIEDYINFKIDNSNFLKSFDLEIKDFKIKKID